MLHFAAVGFHFLLEWHPKITIFVLPAGDGVRRCIMCYSSACYWWRWVAFNAQ